MPRVGFCSSAPLMSAAVASIILISFVKPTMACTAISFSNGDARLVGRNWDYGDSNGVIEFIPAGKRSHAMVLFTRKSLVTDGMNEHGLCMAFTGVPGVPRPPVSPFKRWSISAHIIRDALSRCGTVDETVAFFRKTSIWWGGPWRPQVAYLIADSSGKSCIIDFIDREMVVIEKRDSLQVLLNHHPTRPDIHYARFGCGFCEREDALNDYFNALSPMDERAIMSGLSKVSIVDGNSGNAPTPWGRHTVWSNVYDLRNLRITTVYRRAYGQPVMLDLRRMIKECRENVLIPITEFMKETH